MAFLTLDEKYPEIERKANEKIPGVWGSLREAWVKGFLGIPAKLIPTSAYEYYYMKGRKDREGI